MKRFFLITCIYSLLIVTGVIAEENSKDEGIKTPVEVSFSIITDEHYADIADTPTRFFSAGVKKVEEAVNEWNNQKVDFVVTCGDIVQQSNEKDPARVRLCPRPALGSGRVLRWAGSRMRHSTSDTARQAMTTTGRMRMNFPMMPPT